MEDTNLAILVDAKTEYTNQLINFLKGRSYRCMKELFDETKQECLKEDKLSDVFSTFQKNLANIPKWNENMVKEEYEKMVIQSKCDWLEELLTAVFISHTRILTSIHDKTNKKSVKLVIPKPENFVHQCYIDIAREFWKSPYLFDTNISNYDFQRNRRDIEIMIEKSLQETIRKQLPVKVILKQYLGDAFKEESTDNLSMEEMMSNESKNNLKQMVERELKTLNEEKEEHVKPLDQVENPVEEALEEALEEVIKDTETLENTEPLKSLKDAPTETSNVESESLKETLSEIAKELEPKEEKQIQIEVVDKEDDLLDSLKFDDLEDIYDNLNSDGDVYGLLEDENISNEVSKELNTLNTNVKKVSLVQPEIPDKTTVTKKDNYTFFSDAPTTLD